MRAPKGLTKEEAALFKEADYQGGGGMMVRGDVMERLLLEVAQRRATVPSPDPAALWALVKRWREEAWQRRDGTVDGAPYTVVADTLDACAAELAALLPPEAP